MKSPESRSASVRSAALLAASTWAFASGCGPIPEDKQEGSAVPDVACKDAPAPKVEYVRSPNGDALFDFRNPYLGIKFKVPEQADPNCQLPVQISLWVRRELEKDGHSFIEATPVKIGESTVEKPTQEEWVSGRAEGALRVVDFQLQGKAKGPTPALLGTEDLPY